MTNDPGTGLANVFDGDLDKPAVTRWLGSSERQGLLDGEFPSAAVTIGRLLRSGDATAVSRRRLGTWLARNAPTERLEAAALHVADRCLEARRTYDTTGDPWSFTIARDDLESVLVLLGEALRSSSQPDPAHERIEAKLLATADDLDRELSPKQEEIAAFLEASRTPAWLGRIAPLGEGAWWLDALFLAQLSQTTSLAAKIAERRAQPVRADVPLSLPRKALGHAMSAHLGSNEPGGVDKIFEKPLDAAIASLFDGAVEVYAHGLASGDSGPPGFVVRPTDGAIEHIESVELDPPAPEAPYKSKLDQAVWVPLSGAVAPKHLKVRFRVGDTTTEESLPLEVV
jgi:hypothetical protein